LTFFLNVEFNFIIFISQALLNNFSKEGSMMTGKRANLWIVALTLVIMLALTIPGVQASVQKSDLARSITMGITERISVASDETQANEYYLPLIINNSNVNLARKSISLSARSVFKFGSR
jgi:hypothetical protein